MTPEAPSVRQLRAEQYDVGQTGKKQVADGRAEVRDADAAADKAEKYAASFGEGPGGNDTIITAKQNAKSEAERLRGLANQANTKLDGLVKAFGISDASDPTNPKKNIVGAVNADYNARAADAEVKDLSTKYDQAVAGGDPAKIKDAETALREAQDGQRYMHAVSGDAAAAVDASDAKIEYADAEGAWKAQSLQRPGTYTVTERDGDKQTDKIVKAEGYDPAFWARPESKDGEKVQAIDGKYYYVDGDKKTELDPATARLWAAKDKRDASDKSTAAATSTLEKAKEDLIGGADGKGPKVDAGRYVDNAGAINQRLIDANDAVKKASPKDLGVALEKQRTAQAEFNALKSMENLRTAERDQAAGKPVDPKTLQDLRDTARDLQRKDEETKPRLSPDDEQKMREVQLPQAQKDYDAKAAEVDKLNAPGSTATKAEREKAQSALDAADVTRRDYQSQLGLIDSERDWYAAQNEYGRATFAKPQLSMFMHNGESTTGDIYPQNYDPTWNLKPGDDGKVSAEGLPRGLSPDDIEVRFNPCGGGYTVHIKKDSDVVGWQKSERYGDLRNFVVQKGDYKMNPATARLWATSDKGDGGLAKARNERSAVEKLIGERREEAPTAPDAKPAIGPDGKPVPELRMGDDMTQRKKNVDKGVVDARTARDKAQAAYDSGTGDKTQLKNDLEDAKSLVGVAENEQAAVDAVLLWQDAQRTRQLFESNERAGRMNMSYVKPPSEMESDARAKVVDLRDKWSSSRNAFYTDSTKRDLDAAQAAHNKWKSANPTLAETSSDTWNKLQEAQSQSSMAKRYLVAGATPASASREQNFIAENLRPDQHANGAELYKLFMRDPKLMAQSIINSHYVQYGGDFTQVQNRTHLENIVAVGLGWKPDLELDPATPANNAQLQQTRNLFTHLDKDQKAVLDKTVDALVKQGGEKAKVMVLPVVYGVEGDKGGIVKTALFKVETEPGKVRYVDEQGWDYSDLDDYRANNNLPVQGVDLVTPEDGNFSIDHDGNVKLFSGDARTETDWEEIRRVGHLDVVAGVVGLVAGVVLTVGSFGTLSAPGVMLIAGSAAVLAAGYGVATSAESLIRRDSHGQSISLTDSQARMEWTTMLLSVASVPVIGASTRATMQAMRARAALNEAVAAHGAGDLSGAAKHVADYKRYTQSSQAWSKPAAAAGKPLGYASAGAFADGAIDLARRYDQMTPAERERQIGMMALNASGFASPLLARGYLKVHNTVKPTTVDTAAHAAVLNDPVLNAHANGADNVISPDGRRPADVSAAENPVHAAARPDALEPFREVAPQGDAPLPQNVKPLHPVAPETPVPDNVTVLHPDGPPRVPAEEATDAALAPVISLTMRRAGEGPEPGPGSAPASARRPQEQEMPMAVGADHPVANAPFTRSPQREAAVRPLNAQASANQGGGNAHGQGPDPQSNPTGQARPPQSAGGPVRPVPASSGQGSHSGPGAGGPGGPTPPSTPAAPTPAGGFRGWMARISGPTRALLGFGGLQGGAITAKLLGHGGFFDTVTGGPFAAWVNQTRGLGTRGAYYTGKRGLENALEFARTGDTAKAVKQIDLVAQHKSLRGLSPEEIASKKQKAVDQLTEFGDASARYHQGLRTAGVPETVADTYAVRLATESEVKAGANQKLPEMPDGTLIRSLEKIGVRGYETGRRKAGAAEVARIVDAYHAGDSRARAALDALPDAKRAQLLSARDAELAYAKVRDMVNTDGNLINMKDVQGALGSTMHMGSRVGFTFKYLALGFAVNSGGSGVYNFARQAFASGAWGLGKGGLKTAGLSGEVVGNVPNIGIQWNYLSALRARTKFSDAGPDSKVPIADVRAYLDKRLGRMEYLHDKWWGGLEKRMFDGTRTKAKASVEADAKALAQANLKGDPVPLENRNFSKHVLLRKQQAAERVKALKDAIDEAARTGDEAPLRAMAKTESEKAAKSMNTAGDFMALPSMYRYFFMGVLAASTGHPVLAGITMFHGIVSNGGWLRAQQGKGTIYRMNMVPSGINEGNGLFGVGKRIARGYNNMLDKAPDSVGEKLAQTAKSTPVVGRFAKTDNLFESLKLGTGAEDAANRRRMRLLLTGAITPTVNLVVALTSDDKKQQPPVQQVPVTPPGKSPSPTAPSTTPPPTSTTPPPTTTTPPPTTTTPPPTTTTPPPTANPTPILVTVDGDDPDTATLWGISEDNQKTLLTQTQLGEALRVGGENRVVNEALSQLFNLNPRFDRRLMDGVVSNVVGDPDTLLNGWQIEVGQKSA
jgi:hypothetical protein